jgi:uncharacterized protein DUF6941
MEAVMLLCDAAEQVNGKLYILGGGWSTIFAVGQPANVTLAVKLLIPWDQTNRPHPIAAKLLTEDGDSVDLGAGPVAATGQIEVGRPPGLKPGTPIDVPLVFPFGGLLLEQGGYVFALEVDGEPVARTPFRVIAPPPGFTFP